MESRSNSFPIDLKVARLTSDLDVDSVGHRVSLEVAGVAAVCPGLVPADALQHEAGAADEDAPLLVLHHALVLDTQLEVRSW